MNHKIRIGVIFGGRSGEHEVSLMSARSILSVLDPDKYEVTQIAITHEGSWFSGEDVLEKFASDQNENLTPVTLLADPIWQGIQKITETQQAHLIDQLAHLDVVFPVLHGTFGEDGTVQGLLKLADIPFVGAGVLGSAVGMDKDAMKRLLRDAGISIAKFLVFDGAGQEQIDFAAVTRELGLPLFVKPANLGSSVGISKAKSEAEFRNAVKDAFRYDQKILVEECIVGREIECSVLGNDDARASLPGEILPDREFYDYDSKYAADSRTELVIPARIDATLTAAVQDLGKAAFHAVDAAGYARVDCFVERASGRLLLNEINTIPGFTSISMFPKLWEASGLSYPELLARLVTLGVERHQARARLSTRYGG